MRTYATKDRTTNQKRIILDFLEKNKNHPTAENIYSTAKKKLPQISRGTVYRNLKKLKEKGNIQEISSNGVSHFDGDVSSHSHFICRECHRIFDIFEETCRNCSFLRKQKTKVGKINNYKINFYGYCRKCGKKEL